MLPTAGFQSQLSQSVSQSLSVMNVYQCHWSMSVNVIIQFICVIVFSGQQGLVHGNPGYTILGQINNT